MRRISSIVDDPPDTLRFVRDGRNVIGPAHVFKNPGARQFTRSVTGSRSQNLIQVLQKTRQPFNVSGLAQAAALAGLDERRTPARNEAPHR